MNLPTLALSKSGSVEVFNFLSARLTSSRKRDKINFWRVFWQVEMVGFKPTVLSFYQFKKYIMRAGPQLRVDAYGVSGFTRPYRQASLPLRHSFCTLLRRPHGPLPAPSPSLADALPFLRLTHLFFEKKLALRHIKQKRPAACGAFKFI